MDSPANTGVYIPIPARGNNKLLHIVTDPKGQTTGRSLQALYQVKWILNSTLKVWMRKQLSLEQEAIDKLGSTRPSFDKASGSEGGSRSPSRYLGVPCPCPLVIQSGITVFFTGAVPTTCTTGHRTMTAMGWTSLGARDSASNLQCHGSEMVLVQRCTIHPGARGSQETWRGALGKGL